MKTSRKGFPFPLPLYALGGFVHPAPGSVFAAAHWHEGEALACNGHVALRAGKGAWLPEDFAPPAAGFLERFLGLPWVDGLAADAWRSMDDLGALLYRQGAREVFEGGKLAACPAVRVNGRVVVPLSLLQLVGMLPRCAVWCGPMDQEDALAFSFSGGRGLIGNHGLREAAFSIFEPNRHDDGSRVGKYIVPPSLPLPGWPPVDESDNPTSV
ncbi:MAG: hypothetical protein WCK77_20445 [Verrucomicrobiota bacterium]